MSADHAPVKKGIPWGMLAFGFAAIVLVGVAYNIFWGEVAAGSRTAHNNRYAISWTWELIFFALIGLLLVAWIAQAALKKKEEAHH